METHNNIFITVKNVISAPLEKTWELWTRPEHIVNWNNASDDWHTPTAQNDLRPGGRFVARMEAKDGSVGFDFGGTYEEVSADEYLAYKLDDGRKVTINFSAAESGTEVIQRFEPENTNSIELQQSGWQAILNNFKRYAETNYLT